MSLPERRQPDEDAYLARMQAASAEEVVEAVDAAFAARRPLLAARLVQLLDHDDLPEDASLTRALRVAASNLGQTPHRPILGDALWEATPVLFHLKVVAALWVGHVPSVASAAAAQQVVEGRLVGLPRARARAVAARALAPLLHRRARGGRVADDEDARVAVHRDVVAAVVAHVERRIEAVGRP